MEAGRKGGGRASRPPARLRVPVLAVTLTLVVALLASALPVHATPATPPSTFSPRPEMGARPAANFTIPTIGANTTGFAVSATDLGMGGNHGLRTVAPIPPLPANLSTNATLVLALGETINSTTSAFVGFAEGQAFGLSAAVPFSYVNESGNVTVGTGPYLLPPGGALHTFSFQEVHGPWWRFTVDGNLLTGGPQSQGNGTFDLGSSSALGFAATLPPAPSLALVVTGNHSPAPTLSLPDALSFLGPSGWVNATSAECIVDQGVGLAGYLQDPTIQPGALSIAERLPSLSPLTALWNTGPLPEVSLNVTGLPATTLAGTGLDLRAWVNSTGGQGVAATLNVTDALGALIETSPGGTAGSFLITFQPPGVPTPTPDTLTVRATAAGFVGRVLEAQTTITPSNLSVLAPPGVQGVLSNGTLLLSYLLINGQGGPWSASSATVTVSPEMGSAQVLPPGMVGSGGVVVLYHAPVVDAPATVNLTLSAVAPGFPPVNGTARVEVLPRPLALSVPALPVLSPGQTLTLRFGVAGPGLGPGPLDNGTWTTSGVAPTPGEVTLGPFQALGYGKVSAALHVSSNFTGNLTLQLHLTIPGYAPASVTLPLVVLANASLVPEHPPLRLAAGSQGTVIVQVLTPLPLIGGTVLLTASGGSWAGGSGGTLRLVIPSNGSIRAVLTAPLALVNTPVTVQVTLHAVGFHPEGIHWMVTVHPSWQSFFGQVWAYPLLIGVGVGLALLAVWIARRRRIRPTPEEQTPVGRAGHDEAPGPAEAPGSQEYSEGEGEGPSPPS